MLHREWGSVISETGVANVAVKNRHRLDQYVTLYSLTKPNLCYILSGTIIVGFIIGLIARGIMPGGQHLGFITTTLLGIAGSIVGGMIGRLFSKPEPGSAI